MIAETAQQNQQEELPQGPLAKAAGLAVVIFMLVAFAYLAICVAASTWLTFQVPITNEDMRNASFLSLRVGVYWHGSVIGGLFALYGLGGLLSLRLSGLIPIVLGLSAIFATSEVSALRQGVLDGDIKIGCYSYESLECRKQLEVPVGDAQSIFRDPSEMRHGGYAQWYEPIRAAAEASVTAEFPNTMPGVALLQSPILVMKHMDKLKSLVAAQREEVARFKATLAKP
ncbi:hypothetical protein KZ843_06755 [Pseudomonas aeruginosa]|nr:hypothetical protein [Pseudomonas aeruginosa]MBW6122592.1 hypothetical protein [Pseudomonas aeruginosa]